MNMAYVVWCVEENGAGVSGYFDATLKKDRSINWSDWWVEEYPSKAMAFPSKEEADAAVKILYDRFRGIARTEEIDLDQFV